MADFINQFTTNNQQQFTPENALPYLLQVSEAPTLPQNLLKLAGRVATTILTMPPGHPGMAVAYLKAAAQQLPASQMMATQVDTVAAGGGASMKPPPIGEDPYKPLGEVLQAVGWCAAQCQPRTQIAESGILPVLQDLYQQYEHYLAPVHVEFLQVCIFAGDYRLAESTIKYKWPRPNPKRNSSALIGNVEHVLRYYYLRGTVHMGTRNWNHAVRSLWTCLSIPGSDSNVVSAIAVAAWKKLVLVQCVQDDALEPAVSGGPHVPSYYSTAFTTAEPQSSTMSLFDPVVGSSHSSHRSSGPLSTPKEMPAGLARFIGSARLPSGSQSLGTASPTEDDEPMTSPRSNRAVLPVEPPPEEHGDATMHMVEMEGDGENIAMEDNTNNERNNRCPSLGVSVYRALVEAFLVIDRTRFSAIAQEHGAIFQDDGNWGMVKMVDAILLRRSVYDISSMYATIGQDQLAAELGLSADQLRTLLATLSSEKSWPIQVTDDGVVCFPKLPPTTAASMSCNPDELIVRTSKEIAHLTKTVKIIDAGSGSGKLPPAAAAASMARKDSNRSDKNNSNSNGPRGVEDV